LVYLQQTYNFILGADYSDWRNGGGKSLIAERLFQIAIESAQYHLTIRFSLKHAIYRENHWKSDRKIPYFFNSANEDILVILDEIDELEFQMQLSCLRKPCRGDELTWKPFTIMA